jgi:hypothetical protein
MIDIKRGLVLADMVWIEPSGLTGFAAIQGRDA